MFIAEIRRARFLRPLPLSRSASFHTSAKVTMATQQKALWLKSKQGSFEVGDKDIPKPGPGEILVKIHATALNPVDWKIQASGRFYDKYPAVLGLDSAGTVEEVGEGVSIFKQGDRVIHEGNFNNDMATFQQYTLIPAEIASRLPENISFDEGASIPAALTTAAVGLYNDKEGALGLGLEYPWLPEGRHKYSNKPFFVLGGSSSVGQFAIQFARLSGFSPIITVASPVHTPFLVSLGASDVIDRSLPAADIVAAVARIAGGPVETVFDAIATPETQQLAHDVTTPTGSIVLTLPRSVADKEGSSLRVVSVFGSAFPATARKMGVSLYAHLPALLSEGLIKPNRVKVLPDGLRGIVPGLEWLKAGKVSGQKLVARPQETA
ncbi:hypothetical protein PLICRDRAFT_39221 [Plicaturopsis crispa FD-325 SS-3]|nr:hypothetical protein PLICRDRAFT_39221 [Plicaturopsis crispa FD-325 SS-3]